MKVRISDAWSLAVDGLEVSANGHQAHELTITVTEPGSGYGPSETPEQRASVKISADDWREIVATVERRLIQRGDPQR